MLLRLEGSCVDEVPVEVEVMVGVDADRAVEAAVGEAEAVLDAQLLAALAPLDASLALFGLNLLLPALVGVPLLLQLRLQRRAEPTPDLA